MAKGKKKKKGQKRILTPQISGQKTHTHTYAHAISDYCV